MLAEKLGSTVGSTSATTINMSDSAELSVQSPSPYRRHCLQADDVSTGTPPTVTSAASKLLVNSVKCDTGSDVTPESRVPHVELPHTTAMHLSDRTHSGDVFDKDNGASRFPFQGLKPQNIVVPSIRVESFADSNLCQAVSSYSNASSTSRFDIHDFDMPPDLMEDMLGWSSHHSSDVSSALPWEHVDLPDRYLKDITRETDQGGNSNSEDMSNREKDLGDALKWIRQEILELREQDRQLLRQFMSLRSSIQQLRGHQDIHGSCSDVSSLAGSSISLYDQHVKSPRLRRIALESDMFLKPSISLPSSPRVMRFKWKSDEFI